MGKRGKGGVVDERMKVYGTKNKSCRCECFSIDAEGKFTDVGLCCCGEGGGFY